MLKRILKTAVITFMCNSLAYTPLLRAEQLSLPSGDLAAPEITQEKYVQSVASDSDHEIMVKVIDDVGVKQVTLYFRHIGQSDYKRRTMQQIGNSDDYLAKVNAAEIKPPGIEYYIQAMDLAGNTILHGYKFAPLSVKVDSASTQPGVADSADQPIFDAETAEEKKGISKWVWIGLGALVVGAVAAGGGSSGGDAPAPSTATLNVNASVPTN
jgi:hypothetical protein